MRRDTHIPFAKKETAAPADILRYNFYLWGTHGQNVQFRRGRIDRWWNFARANPENENEPWKDICATVGIVAWEPNPRWNEAGRFAGSGEAVFSSEPLLTWTAKTAFSACINNSKTQGNGAPNKIQLRYTLFVHRLQRDIKVLKAVIML